MDVYVWYNHNIARYEIGSRIDFEVIMSRDSRENKPELLYRFNRLSSKLAYKMVEELNSDKLLEKKA